MERLARVFSHREGADRHRTGSRLITAVDRSGDPDHERLSLIFRSARLDEGDITTADDDAGANAGWRYG
jgi:hypothetical protein